MRPASLRNCRITDCTPVSIVAFHMRACSPAPAPRRHASSFQSLPECTQSFWISLSLSLNQVNLMAW